MLRQQCGICPYCGCKMAMSRAAWLAGNYPTVDHVTPRAIEDQPPSKQVVVLCCRSCNAKKADRPLLPFLLDLFSQPQKQRPDA